MLRFALIFLLAMGLAHFSAAQAEDPEIATIVDSGSTNRAGFRIAVYPSGKADLTFPPRRFESSQAATKPIDRALPQSLVDRFYADLMAAKPLASLPVTHCAKSASFGSTLIVSFRNEQTPDLSCGDAGNAVLRDLIGATRQIAELMNAADASPKREIR
ncbi:MAG: hypothetical protein M3N93_00530 [Acidobacteriota bacterium]|nr:hypothetical protein [Acidobacteriota bacterium]